MNPTYKMNWLVDTLHNALDEALKGTEDYNDIMASFKLRCDRIITMYKRGYNLEYETVIAIFDIYEDSLREEQEKGGFNRHVSD